MRLGWEELASCIALAGALGACVTPATEVIVLVDTDGRARVASMRAVVARSADTSGQIRTWGGGADASARLAFPGSFAIVPGSAPNDGTVTLRLSLDFASPVPGGPTVSVTRAARFRFTPHVTMFFPLYIPVACTADVAAPLRCPDGHMPCSVAEFCAQSQQTCGDDGRCVAIDVTPHPYGDGGFAFDGASSDVRDAFDGFDARDATDADACSPVCASRRCGADGCGGTCGTCASTEICTSSGSCVACTAGTSCDTGNACTDGTTMCGSGSAMCVVSGNRGAGTECGGTGQCDGNGNCVSCMPGWIRCGTSCVDPSSDGANCGSCGSACGIDSHCEGGSCRCDPGHVMCIDCVDLGWNDRNCGSCGHICGANEYCNAGSCVCRADYLPVGGVCYPTCGAIGTMIGNPQASCCPHPCNGVSLGMSGDCPGCCDGPANCQ